MAYVRDFLPGMTVMTLMTVIYGLILDRVRSSTS
jgi:hypothetical protein